jgi:CspA family cold shock protein
MMVREWHGKEGWGVLDAPEVPGGCWAHYSMIDMGGYRGFGVWFLRVATP